jgi:hypothetical protein
MAVPGLMMGSALFGTLAVDGHGTQQVAVGPCASGLCIDFDWAGTLNAGPPQTVNTGGVDGTGDVALFDITNNFSTLNGGSSTEITVHDLNSTNEPAGVVLGSPLANFITFGSDPWSISLTELRSGSDGQPAGCPVTGPPVDGQICTPVGSPFNEQNSCTGSTPGSCTVAISLSFLGVANDGSGHLSNVIGTFSTTFSGTDFQAINFAISNGSDVVTSDSGTLNITAITGTPEPATSALIGGGLIGLGFLARKRRKAA